jgi:hypothetical protein
VAAGLPVSGRGMPRCRSRSSSMKSAHSSGPPASKISARTRKFVGGGAVPQAPRRELGHDRHELDRRLGEAVGRALSALDLVAREQARLHQGSQTTARMLEAMPSSDSVRSRRKCRRLPNMTSRSTIRLQ